MNMQEQIFPTSESHTREWMQLAKGIGENAEALSETASGRDKPGSLTILGSGIEAMGFAVGDEALIRAADKVLYCVADPATVVWLKELRPDALDLYVLYGEEKVRYHTYVQMTEAMLYYLRQGLNVVAVYYGHPGIFVLSTHRAVAIARREGYQAVMRPGISALDCLCADLGVDPSQPGMVTFEATDMILRQRRPDTALHVILWQVGLIAELGYRRKGYLNEGFSIFVEYLQKVYGDDYTVTNYVASRYPGASPIIENYTLSQLHDPEIQARITGISTFYLAPRDVAPADPEMATRLGLLKPGQTIKVPKSPLRKIDGYGENERRALRSMRRFRIPIGYQWQEATAASRFLIRLRTDIALREAFARSPLQTLENPEFAGLSEWEKRLLATGDPGAMQVAAKGMMVKSDSNESFLMGLIRSKKLAKEMAREIKASNHSRAMERIREWAQAKGYHPDWDRMGQDIDLVNRNHLLPWTGVYLAEGPRYLIVIIGDASSPDGCDLLVNGEGISGALFRRGVLKWGAKSGNSCNGYLRVDHTPRGDRQLICRIWKEDEHVPPQRSFVARALSHGGVHPAQLQGRYTCAAGQCMTLTLADTGHNTRELALFLGKERLSGPISLSGWNLLADGRRFPLARLGASDPSAWELQEATLLPFLRHYGVRHSRACARGWFMEMEIGDKQLFLGGSAISDFQLTDNKLTWTCGPAPYTDGDLTLLIDPVTLQPIFFGDISVSAGGRLHVYGAGICPHATPRERDPNFHHLPQWAWEILYRLCCEYNEQGGLMLWYKWEKYLRTTTAMNRLLANILR